MAEKWLAWSGPFTAGSWQALNGRQMATLKRAICGKKWLAMLPFLPFVALTETTNGPFMSCLLGCYGPVVTHCQNAEVWCSFRLTAEVKHKSASPCRDLLTSHQQCKYVNSAIPLGWRALKTPTAQTPGFCGHVTPLTLHYLWPRPPGVWLGGPGCKPGHSRGP